MINKRLLNTIKHWSKIIFISLCCMNESACKKLVEIPPPVSTVSSSQIFTSDILAATAMVGVYSKMINTGNQISFSSGAISLYSGMSADELITYDQNYADMYIQFQNNNIAPANNLIYSNFWSAAYSSIYGANSVITGLESFNGVHDAEKLELISEAKFVRAFDYFYLVNLFGSVPLVTSINYNSTSLFQRSSSDIAYQLIINDLKDAQNNLPVDFSSGGGQRVIPNKWAATAMLARVYLYLGDWANAEKQSTLLINNNQMFSIEPDLKKVFSKNSSETIWQLQQNNSGSTFNATPEGSRIIPTNHTSKPFIFLSQQLLNVFEDKDQRKTAWVDSTVYSNQTYFYPYKYTVGTAGQSANGAITQYYMVLRLAEQYLIRAEAETYGFGNGINGAIADLNIIRNRAGLSNYTGATDPASLRNAIMHERQVELFSEWGHRWLDLKRTGQATSVLTANKGFTVSNNVLLYPIPVGELTVDPNLIQNPGY